MQQLVNQALASIRRDAYVLNQKVANLTRFISTGDIQYLTRPINISQKQQSFGSQQGLFGGAGGASAQQQSLWGGQLASGITGGKKRKRSRTRNKSSGGQQVFGGLGGQHVQVPRNVDAVAQRTAQYLAQMMKNGQVTPQPHVT